MNKSVKACLLLVMCAAIAVLTVLFLRMRDTSLEVASVTRQLEESTARWKQINEDKEALQKELKTAKEELREAELTLEESESRAAELELDIAALEQQLESLKNLTP